MEEEKKLEETPAEPEEKLSDEGEVELQETPLEPTPAPEPDKETLELFKSVRDEVGEKRFDGLMSNWQKDRADLLEFKKREVESPFPQPMELTPQPTPTDDKAWLKYLRTEFKQMDEKELLEENKRVMSEVLSVMSNPDFSELSEKDILNAVGEYSEKLNTAISPQVAAYMLKEKQDSGKTQTELDKENLRRKREAGGISGKTTVEQPTGVRPYDPKKDLGKSYEDLVQDAKGEIGIKTE